MLFECFTFTFLFNLIKASKENFLNESHVIFLIKSMDPAMHCTIVVKVD